jgi:2-phosphoglycolate phosphatase
MKLLEAELVVFDLDGTLIDSAGDLQQAVNHIFSLHGFPTLAEEVVGSFIGHGIDNLVIKSLKHVKKYQDLKDKEVFDICLQIKTSYEKDCLSKTILCDGALELLETLSFIGKKLVVCTNKPEKIANKILTGLGIGKFFDFVVGGDTCGVLKPDPTVLQFILDKSGFSNSECVFIGDSKTDAVLANSCNVPIVIVATGYKQDKIPEYSILINTINQFLGILKSKTPENDGLEAVMFDVDGTLVSNEEYHLKAFNESFLNANISWVWDDELYTRLLSVTGGLERMKFYQNTYLPENEWMEENVLKKIHLFKTEIYCKFVSEGFLKPREGVVELMKECKKMGLKIAIVTTTSAKNVTILLDRVFDLKEEWFDCIVSGESVKNKKPSMDSYVYALNKLGVCANNCIAIEDSSNGYIASRDAGIKSVITVNNYTVNDNFYDADFIVKSLKINQDSSNILCFPDLLGDCYNKSRFIDLEMLKNYVLK